VGNALQDKTVVVVGRGSGIARAVALLARDEGAHVIAAGRDRAKLADAYEGLGVAAETLDITDDTSIAAPTRSTMSFRRPRPAQGATSPISSAGTCSCPSIPRSSGRRCSPNTLRNR